MRNLSKSILIQIQDVFKDDVVLIPLLGYSNGNTDYERAKIPMNNGWNRQGYGSLTEEEVEEHIKKGGWVGLLIPEGYILVDIDNEQQGSYLLRITETLGLKVHAIKTPNGYQFFFRDTYRVKFQGVRMITKGLFVVDYRLANKGYIVLPSGNTEKREWIKLSNDDELSLLPFFLEPVCRAKNDDEVEFPIPIGKRNDTLFRHVSRLRDFIKNEEEIEKIMKFINNNLTEEPLPEKELQKIITPREGYNYELEEKIETEEYYTDFWNADNFVKMYKGKVLFCEPWDTWLLYKNGRWIRDEKNEVIELAKRVIRTYYQWAGNIENDKERKALVEHAIKCEKLSSVKSMLELAKPKLAVLPEQFDTDEYILNVRNGILILDTKELIEHSPDYLLTKMANVEYDPTATCPRWMEFLYTIFNGDEELINFIQKAIGYSLSGDTGEDCFFILYGQGMNGKTTFLNTIKEILGDYCIHTRAETFLLKDYDHIPNDIARLHNRRMVIATELPEGRRFNENLLKGLTGRDTITARFLRQEFFEFRATFKLWIATNHKPIVNENTVAFWRRVKLIPFEVQIPEERRIPRYEEKLLEERSGILNWALEGYTKWRKEGLGTTKKINEAVQSYRDEMDIISDFISECCIEDQNISATTSELYLAYCEWCKKNGIEPISNRSFGRRLEERGYKFEWVNSKRGWRGIGLRKK